MELEVSLSFIGWRKNGMQVEFEGDEIAPGNMMIGSIKGINSQQAEVISDRLKEGYTLAVVIHEPL